MLPRLRQELALYQGPSNYRGEPSWSLHDPVRNLFFRLDWLSFEIISRWSLGDPQQILQDMEAHTPIQAEPDDVETVLRFLVESELVQATDPQSTGRLHELRLKSTTRITDWLLHRYLFFRVPLWRPDSWLQRWQSLVRPFYSRGFRWITLAALMFGLVEVSRQWQTFIASLVDLFSLQGVFSFLITLIFVKFMHELGHAFTAKRYGCRVPTIGVAFLVMFPMAYTDVNDVWKLSSRRQRMMVGAAGITTELFIAAWATFFWVLLPDGFLRGAMFILATTTWISTLIVNASPFLRFDGYFLLMDWLGMPNLHHRAFAFGKWRLRRVLFGLHDDPPEVLPRRRMQGLTVLAYATWMYRLVVFTGIALLVYTMVPKPLGPILAVVELWFFIFRPIVKEMGEWRTRIPEIMQNARIRWVAVLTVLTLLIALFPWDNRIHSQGMLRPIGYYPLVTPEAARLSSLPVAHGQRVEAGAVLLELESPDLDVQQRIAQVREQTLRWQTVTAGVMPELLEQRGTLEAGRAQLQAELVSVQDEKNRLQFSAPIAGLFFLSQLELDAGMWVGRNEQLGTLVDPSAWQVVTYLPESELERIKVGDAAMFYSESARGRPVTLQVARIDVDAARILTDGLLAVPKGGHVPVRETTLGLVPDVAVYRVVLSVDPDYAPETIQLQRGQLVVFGTRKSWLGEYARSAAAVIVREAGF